MEFSRRGIGSLVALAALGGTVASLPGCAGLTGNPLNTAITVNLSVAQAEAQAIYQAFGNFVTVAEGSVSASLATEIDTTYKALGSAVAAFAGLTSGSTTVNAFAQQIIGLIGQLLPLIPATILPGPTGAAISLGLLLLSAFISGLTTINVPTAAVAPVNPTLVGAKQIIVAPIPIPLG